MPPVNSTKSLTGHSLGAAGVHEAIYSHPADEATASSPKSANIDELDPEVADAPIVRKRIDNAKHRHRDVEQLRLRRHQRHAGVPALRWLRRSDSAMALALMAGKRGLIMGVANDHSIAWGIARALAAQGAELAFTYQGEAQAKRLRPLAASVGSELVLPCDVGQRRRARRGVRRARSSEWEHARFRGPRHRLFRQERAQGPLRRDHAARTSSARSTSPAIRSPPWRGAPRELMPRRRRAW